jgi:hypothetical protein
LLSGSTSTIRAPQGYYGLPSARRGAVLGAAVAIPFYSTADKIERFKNDFRNFYNTRRNRTILKGIWIGTDILEI